MLAELTSNSSFFLSRNKITMEHSVVEQAGSSLLSAAGHVISEREPYSYSLDFFNA